jgi:hypothetical protein
MEIQVRSILDGQPVRKTASPDTMANPGHSMIFMKIALTSLGAQSVAR